MRLLHRLGRGEADLALGLGVVAACLLGFVFAVSGGASRLFERGGTTVTATFRSAALLEPGSPVRVGGVSEGKVTHIKLAANGHDAIVTMKVYNEVLPLYRNASASLRWRTALGGTYAVRLDPGTPAAGLLEGNAIAATRTSNQVEVDEVLGALQRDPRTGLRQTLAELPHAFADPAAPGHALDAVADVAPALGQAAAALRGRVPDADLRALVRSTGRTVAALDTTDHAARGLVQGTAATLRVTAARHEDVRRTLALGGPALRNVRLTTRELSATLPLADRLVADLRGPAADVAPTLAVLRPTVTDANALLRHAPPLLRALRPAASALAVAASRGRPVLDHLTPSIARFDREILPDLAKVDKGSRRATYEMIGPTVASLTSAAGSFDAISHYVALTPTAGDRILDTSPCLTYITDPTSDQILKCQSLMTTLGNLFGIPTKPLRKGGR